MNREQKFQSLSRVQQRANLLRRLNRIRREMEQTYRDQESYNDLQRSRGGAEVHVVDDYPVQLAEIDQQIKQVRDSLPRKEL